MSYFAENYDHIRLRVARRDGKGLRGSQLGAYHAVASHFTLSDEPAAVVMPTGSGKTAVLVMAAFALQAERVLVITPSRLVREQISEEFAKLRTLRDLDVVDDALAPPRVKCLESMVRDETAWNQLGNYDVVVTTPSASSPGLKDVPPAPKGLFDVVLVDEAHHSPAATWTALMHSFPGARLVLFTATPFRRDRREMPGDVVYVYPLSRAQQDGIFGQVTYVAAEPRENEGSDRAVARKAAEIFAQDRQAGFDHRLMVRTDRKSRADELMAIYEETTNLQLAVAHSRYSLRHIRSVINKLRSGDLDGVVCVDMMGEGFDLPELKIAAIHAPHRSLGVTLQFIGRFARTAGANLGPAKFVAVPNDVQLERQRLYDEGAVWRELIVDLTESRIDEEVETRRTLASFQGQSGESLEPLDLSLYALRPLEHVKIYEIDSEVDVSAPVSDVMGLPVLMQLVSADLNAAVVLTEEIEQPRWTVQDGFERRVCDLFIVHVNSAARLLFINASRRSTALYEALAKQYTGGRHRILPLYRINRVIRDLKGLECFNVGMRNRVRSSSMESYRIITGSQAQKSVSATDGRLFNRGHIYARVGEGDDKSTIGYSSASKVWSNRNPQLPELIAWCQGLATKIASDAPVKTDCPLDLLNVGEELRSLPDRVIGADWHEESYLRSPELTFQGESCLLVDCDLLCPEDPTGNRLTLELATPGGHHWPFIYSPSSWPYMASSQEGPEPQVVTRRDSEHLIDHLNNYNPSVFAANLSRVSGQELFPAPSDFEPFDAQRIEAWNWMELGVNITAEVNAPAGERSVHDAVRDKLIASQANVVVCDHGTGEKADFLAFQEAGTTLKVTLYHCKKSSEIEPGSRAEDLYEVCGQVLRSVRHLGPVEVLVSDLQRRGLGSTRLIKGNAKALRSLGQQRRTPIYTVAIVQPGLSSSLAKERNLELLAGVEHYALRSGAESFTAIGSA